MPLHFLHIALHAIRDVQRLVSRSIKATVGRVDGIRPAHDPSLWDAARVHHVDGSHTQVADEQVDKLTDPALLLPPGESR